MLKKVILISFFLNVALVSSQKIKFGDVSKETLMEEVYEKDSSANAIFLYSYRYTFFSSSGLVTRVHERIKFYNNEELEYATKEISMFQNGSESESVRKLKAATYNLEGGEIITSKLEKDQIFKEEINRRWKQKKFTMPNVKKRSVIEYQYELVSPFIFNIDEFRFQHGIPVKQLEAEVRTPQGYKFRQQFKGYLRIQPLRDSKYDNRIGLNMNIVRYEMNDIPALKSEAYVDNISNYRSGLKMELVSVERPGYYRSYAQTWQDVASRIAKTDDYEKELEKNSMYKEDIDTLLVGVTDEKEKVEKVFSFMKEKVKWNGYDGVNCQKEFKKAYKDGTGNTADVNLMLVSMLRYAGLEANPIVISTKDNGVPLIPTLDGLNYVIGSVEIGEELVYLDATDKYSAVDILPVKDYNWQGVMVKAQDKKYRIININHKKSSLKQIMLSATLDIDGGSIEGRMRTRYKDHHAYVFRKQFNAATEDEYLATLESENMGIEISEYKLDGNEDLSKPVVESYRFLGEDLLDVVGNEVYFSPMLFLLTEENPFKAEKREFPIDFAFPNVDKFLINIKIPEGYKITSVPEPIAFSLPDDVGKYKFQISQKGNTIQLVVSSDIKKALMSPVYYPQIKQYFSEMITKESEKVVLTKI